MASIKYKNVFLKENYSICSKLEKEGNINPDLLIDNYYFGCKTFEGAEIKMQRVVIDYLLTKNKKIDLIIGGDLSNQLAITSYMACKYDIPYLGMYSACATFNSALLTMSNLIDSKKIKNGIVITSSHNKVAERQFRYPIEYGAPKTKYSTYTATGSSGVILSREKTNIKVESSTIGKVIDSKIKDVNNMGAVMAIAACDTLNNHLKDLNREANYYDLIITGDLGIYGSKIFKEYMNKEYNTKINNYIDAGANIYKKDQKLFAGSSGPVSLPLYLFTNILNNSKYKKILLLATGSLHSPTLINQKNNLLSTCHAISLEVLS